MATRPTVGAPRRTWVQGGAEISVSGLTWRPARRRTPVLRDLHLHIPAGQRVLVTGPSGAGKSTLLRALAGLLLTATDGDLTGDVLVDGAPVSRAVQRPALLFQDPQAGIVADTVGRDVAFGLENSMVPRKDMWAAVTAALDTTGLRYPLDHPTAALSGGESQRLALAASLVLGSRVLLLDEPMSMLDPAAAGAVSAAVRHHVDALRPTMVVVDHQLEPWLDLVDRVIVLDADGTLVADGDPHCILDEQGAFLAARGVWVPAMAAPAPIDVPPELVAPRDPGPAELVSAERVGLLLTNRLTRRQPPTVALSEVDAVLRSGRTLAVTGPSGAGKSSLVSVLAGLRRPTSGRVYGDERLRTRRGLAPYRWSSRDLAGRLSWVPQTPEQGMVAHRVIDEVLATSRACGRDAEWSAKRAAGLLDLVGLSALRAASPYHLSGGEQRRLMVAAALTAGPYGVLLDEPTIGQDRFTWAAVCGVLNAAKAAGVGIGLATHDARAVAVLADEEIGLDRGVRVR